MPHVNRMARGLSQVNCASVIVVVVERAVRICSTASKYDLTYPFGPSRDQRYIDVCILERSYSLGTGQPADVQEGHHLIDDSGLRALT
jgi:hypothetical protein